MYSWDAIKITIYIFICRKLFNYLKKHKYENFIETINKIHIQNKKAEAAKDVKKLEIEGKKEIQKLKNDGYLNLPQGNTNVLVATREEIIAQLTGKAKEKAVNVTQVIELSAET